MWKCSSCLFYVKFLKRDLYWSFPILIAIRIGNEMIDIRFYIDPILDRSISIYVRFYIDPMLYRSFPILIISIIPDIRFYIDPILYRELGMIDIESDRYRSDRYRILYHSRFWLYRLFPILMNCHSIRRFESHLWGNSLWEKSFLSWDIVQTLWNPKNSEVLTCNLSWCWDFGMSERGEYSHTLTHSLSLSHTHTHTLTHIYTQEHVAPTVEFFNCVLAVSLCVRETEGQTKRVCKGLFLFLMVLLWVPGLSRIICRIVLTKKMWGHSGKEFQRKDRDL